jgi:hypothetical protein
VQAQQRVREGDVEGLRALYEQLAIVSEAERVMLENEGYLLFPDMSLPFDNKEEVVSRDPANACVSHQPAPASHCTDGL